MKQLTAWDTLRIGDSMMYVIKRVDPYKWLADGELPKPGETVEIDGAQHVVQRADLMGDSEFKYYPHIAIFVELLSAGPSGTERRCDGESHGASLSARPSVPPAESD